MADACVVGEKVVRVGDVEGHGTVVSVGSIGVWISTSQYALTHYNLVIDHRARVGNTGRSGEHK